MALFGLVALFTLGTMKVNGPVYQEIVMGKDVIADILPPPEYLVETHLMINRLTVTEDPGKVATLAAWVQTLWGQYEDRHAFWLKQLPEGGVKQLLVNGSYRSAVAYSSLVIADFLPAVQAGDLLHARAVLENQLHPLYEQHRAVIDELVEVQTAQSLAVEQGARTATNWVVAGLVAGALAIVLAVSNVGSVIPTAVTQPLAAVLTETDLLLSVATQRRLDQRGDENQFHSPYRDLIRGVNNIIDTVSERADQEQQARQESRFKTDFFANTSHELRTPLNAILGYSDVLLAGVLEPLNEEQQDAVIEIRDGGRHLLALINDILDTSKIEAGKLQIDLAPIDLATVIADARRTIEPLLSAKAHQLSTHVDPALPQVMADDLRVKQILLNLLSNAVKFIPNGGHLTVSAAKVNQMIQVSAADNGPGIPPHLVDAVFRKCERVGDKDAQKGIESTVLGLPLARELARLHGGEMWCESDVGCGATFHFTLCLAEAQPVVTGITEPLAA